MKTYIVKRPHQGDKWYSAGENREANPHDVAHLVVAGVLVDPDDIEDADGDSDQHASGDGSDATADDDQKTSGDGSDARGKPAPKVENKAVKAAGDKKSD